MHFNCKELAGLATLPSYQFDKEGLLFVRERQEGLFWKNEAVFQERYCKLRGNLLFYHKSKDPSSEPVGLWVLEHCSIHLDGPGDPPASFYLSFQWEECQQLVAPSLAERDSWVQVLHMASYQYIRSQLCSLRTSLERHQSQTSVSPPSAADMVTKRSRPFVCIAGNYDAFYNEPFLELSLACSSLQLVGSTPVPPPSTMIVMEVLKSPGEDSPWLPFSQSEIVERNPNPCYMSTVTLSKAEVKEITRLRLLVVAVQERVTATNVPLGQCSFSLQDLLNAPLRVIRLPLALSHSTVSSNSGFAMVSARELSLPLLQSSTLPARTTVPPAHNYSWKRSQSLPSLANAPSAAPLQGPLQPVFSRVIQQSYRLPTALGAELRVHEIMAETPLTFTFPQHLLNLWIHEEKKLMDYIFKLGEVPAEWQQRQLHAAERHLHLINVYTEALNALSSRDAGQPDLKPSSHKADPSLECAPVNLHLQRMVPHNLYTDKVGAYDVMTVGAFTAYCQGYKRGGLLKMLKPTSPLDSVGSQLRQAAEAINLIEHFQTDLEQTCEELTAAARSRCGPSLQTLVAQLHNKGQRLVASCQARLPEDVAALWDSISLQAADDSQLPSNKNSGKLTSSRSLDGKGERLMGWRTIDDLEPLDLLYLNVRASVMCLVSKAAALNASHGDWQGELAPSLGKLRAAATGLHHTAAAAYGLLALRHSPHSAILAHKTRWRRDVVFSQALTSLVAGIMARLWTRQDGQAQWVATLRATGGLLAQFEGLLSCHRDEAAMMEDMVVAIADISRVNFRLEPLAGGVRPARPQPRTEGNRARLLVVVPCPDTLGPSFNFNVTPVFFNIGINELATIAHKVGSVALQEKINCDGASLLQQFYRKFLRLAPPGKGGLAEIPGLLEQLTIQISSRKQKNFAVLHLAAEVTRQLGGLRFTSCKSAKDRTSMSVTLEQALILRRHFNLEEKVFSKVLDCMRSEGTRRECPLKNVGARKYHFNKLKLFYLPALYRPPPGTYGEPPYR